MINNQHASSADEAISGLLSKVRSIVRLSRKSNIIQIKMKELIKKYGLEKVNFIIDFHVRWNSSFLIIQKEKLWINPKPPRKAISINLKTQKGKKLKKKFKTKLIQNDKIIFSFALCPIFFQKNAHSQIFLSF
jgi:hypothetical protein